MLGYTHAQFIGKHFREVVAPEFLELWTSRFEQRTGSGDEPPRNYEAAFVNHGGETVWVELRASRYRYQDRPAVLGIVRDVTERNRAERARLLLASIVESSDDAIISIGLDGIITSWNKGAEAMYQYTEQEAIGQPMALIIPPDRRDDERTLVDHLRHGRALKHYETVRRRKDGSTVEVSVTLSPMRDQRGVIVGASKSARDIGARRRADTALREREEIFSAIVNQAADGIVLIDMNSARFVEFNDAACEVLGYTREEFAQLSLTDIFVGSPEELQRTGQAVLDAPGGLQFDVRHRCRDGSTREVYVSARIIRLRERAYSAAIWHDITEERRAAAALRESEHRLRELTESLPQLVWTCAPDGACDYLGPQWVAYTGLGAAAQLGSRWLEQVHPEDRAAFTAAWAASTQSGNALDAEFRLRRHDGAYRWFYARAVPLRNVEGQITKWFGTGTDMTDRRAAEQQMQALNLELEERVKERTAQLAAANKELETFAYSVSHDLKAPLRGIDGYSKLLLQDYSARLPEEGRTYIENVRRATLQMNNLIDDLLAYSRMERQHLHFDDVEIAPVVDLAVKERREELAAREVELKLDLPPRLAAKADLDGLLIVLRNLLENAIKFTRDARPPRIEIGGREGPDMVAFWVRDNGIGFDMKYQDRIFEIFQRLQRAEEYPGTGIGLALVRKAVARLGGRVWCESSPGHGATFFVELPH
jgi:PAS domain S-box-containing protein